MRRSARRPALALLCLLCLGAAPAPPPASAPVQALVGGRLIDGYGGPPVDDSVIVLRGDRIEAAGRMGQVPIPEEAQVISTEGMSVLPGLWDMHVHLMIVGHGDYA